MKQHLFRIAVSVVLVMTGIAAHSQEGNTELGTLFSHESFTMGSVSLPYRRAYVSHDDAKKPALVLYLHGGTSRGYDNEAPLQEKAISDIYAYLDSLHIAATLIVPQCPEDGDWTVLLHRVVYELLNSYVKTGQANTTRIYVMGGSMGGTGTWYQLSSFPNFYAAAMPVAGNPEGLNAENVATTPVLTVMGTADVIMDIATVRDFHKAVLTAGGTMTFDIEVGWSHLETCEQSFTAKRLDWLFSQVRNTETGIRETVNRKLSNSKYFDLSGRRVEQPTRGLYILNGKKVVIR